MPDSDIVIRVEDLGKCYKLGQTHHHRLSDFMMDVCSRAVGKFRAPAKDGKVVASRQKTNKGTPLEKDLNSGSSEGERISKKPKPRSHRETNEFWALRNVSFEVKRGDVVGIIGLNGAGKSTLFKLLSKITEPTEGRATMKGRVGSLLEVGTGFHPELTGRENIFLNGAILGMTRREIKSKFDQIVEFAGIDRFLDTPVKRYSSGMYVRLAFAVAAHFEPEILLVDEVLAVGDISFQQKCLGKMKEVTGQGRTILFVSHTMPSIESLCGWSIVLDGGHIDFQGNTEKAIAHYLKKNKVSSTPRIDLSSHRGRSPKYRSIFQSLRLKNDIKKETSVFRVGESILFESVLKSDSETLHSPCIQFHIRDHRDISICKFMSTVMVPHSFEIIGTKIVKCYWRNCRLVPGLYSVSIEIRDLWNCLDQIDYALSFEIQSTDIYGTGKLKTSEGLILPDADWEFS